MNTTTMLTNEQKARIFAMYIGSDVLIEGDKISAPLEAVNICGAVFSDAGDAELGQTIDEAKLLLTPLARITDEDAVELAKIEFPELNWIPFDSGNNWMTLKANGGGYIFYICYDGGFGIDINGESAVFQNDGLLYQFLTQRSYAVPLFIAPNHPDNGKTAIELGLAIDKTLAP